MLKRTDKTESAAIIAESINVTDVLTLIISEITGFSRMYSHVDPSRLMVSIASNRSNSRGGAIYGKLVPLRFENGERALRYKGRLFCMPEVQHTGISQLYIIYFYMPRFFDLPADEKLRVIFHEMYHISPEFNGDIRRMAKKKSAHGHSKKHFDSLFIEEAAHFEEYIKTSPYYNFLSQTSADLKEHFSNIVGNRIKVPRPQLVKP